MEIKKELYNSWKILQDVHDLGEKLRIYMPGWSETDKRMSFSEWEEIPYFSHLQMLLSDTPYFGRELRYFNHAPWWYKNEFDVNLYSPSHAVLRFEAVDYYCKVWFNGEYIGEHEGYSAPFEFNIGHLLRRGEKNLVIVKVSSPWDKDVLEGEEHIRTRRRLCGMFKGTYEHDDTFIARDVNPIGIWNGVSVIYHDGVRVSENMRITAVPSEDFKKADVSWVINADSISKRNIEAKFTFTDPRTMLPVLKETVKFNLIKGGNKLEASFVLDNPAIWEIWERGEPYLYTLVCELYDGENKLSEMRVRFGIRKAEMIRNSEMVRFKINGKNLFLRGGTYFPDVYVSNMTRERYLRDVRNAKAAGFNALRIHVHVARQEFYDVCDELGMMVFQDSDFNWSHPNDEAFTARAVKVFGDMIKCLYNHPSITCWIVMNEPQDTPQLDYMYDAPGPQLMEKLLSLDTSRPYIKGSCRQKDPDSGDTHDYTGALDENWRSYDAYDVTYQRLNTEYGMDSPPVAVNLRSVPKLYKRMRPIEGSISALQYHQYRYIKYVTEEFRMNKYAPCGGYFHFMFIDLCPQSGYGVYDWWGVPKPGLEALYECNNPIGIFLKIKDGGKAVIFCANDNCYDINGLILEWIMLDKNQNNIWSGNTNVNLTSDGIAEFAEAELELAAGGMYDAYLTLKDKSGNFIARNRYKDILNHPRHPEGHSDRMSKEFGVRLFHV